MISDEARRYLPPNTPDWILAIIDAGPHGGWFTPFRVGEGHPLVVEEWPCLHCNDPFRAGDVAFVQPFQPAEGDARWTATHRGCMAEALGIADLLEMSPIERFYRGQGTDSAGRTFEVGLAMSDDEWEASHNHIQWMFPLPELSKAQPSSPVMTERDLEVFRTDEEVRANVLRAYNRWILFLASTSAWERPRDHNHLRITRVIRFLTLLGMDAQAEECLNWTLKNHPALPEQTAWYWREARKEHPAWLS